MRSEKLYDAITEVDDALVNEAGDLPAKQRKKTFLRPRWIGVIAAVLALVIVATLVLRPGSGALTAYALEKPVYPATSPFPDFSDLMSGNENIDKAALEAAYEAWEAVGQTRRKAQKNYSGEMLNDYLTAAIPAFLSGHDGENAACSPVDLYLSLAMLAETTDGAARDQILSLLGVENMDSLRKLANSLFLANYIDDGAQKSLLASAIWLRDDMNYNAETVKRLAETYYAASFRGTMGSEDYDNLLRQWLNEQTENLLADQVGELSFDPQTVLALTTTVDYAAKWYEEFQPERTIDASFHAINGEEPCRMMRQSESSHYCWGENFGATDLLLNSGGRVRFLLPDEGVSPEALLQDPEAIRFLLTPGYDAWKNNKYLVIHLSLPKFDISSQLNLEGALKGLGVQDVFDSDSADFSPLTDTDGVYLSEVKHGARVAMDEDGVTASAFTMMKGPGAAEPPTDEIDFTLDRPFLFAVYGEDELPLFVGIVNHPTADGAAEGVKRPFNPAELQTAPEADQQTIPETTSPTEAETQEEKLEYEDMYNLRNAYAEAMSEYLQGTGNTSRLYAVHQQEPGWVIDASDLRNELTDAAAELSRYTDGHFSLTVTVDDDGNATFVLNHSEE